MTPAEYIKLKGFRSLDEFCEITGESKRTIQDWHSTRPRRLEVLIEGALVIKEREVLKRLKEKREK